MPSTVNKAFNKFLEDLEPLQSEKEKIQKRHKYLRETFNNKIKNDGYMHSFLSGSYARNTQIRPINDVDIVILFDWDTYWDDFKDNPIEMLNFTYDRLKETYRDRVFLQRHSIGIKFESVPDVDVIPGFIQNLKEEVFLIPNYEENSFIKTSPTKHKSMISNHNQKVGMKFVHLIKMMKCWRNKIKREKGIKIKSFHLEVLLMNILTTPIIEYPKALYHLFSKGSQYIEKQCYDPAGLSGRLDTYLSYSDKQNLREIFEATSTKIKKLLELKKMGRDQDAIKGWREIFGDPFPLPIITKKDIYKKDLTTKFPSEGKNYTYGDLK